MKSAIKSLRGVLRAGGTSLAVTMLSGCAHYTALPLPAEADLVPSMERLHRLPENAGPLTVEQVAALALENNPDLKAARLQRDVARGQTKQAGILPNPSLSGAFLPLLSGSGTVPAWSAGLSQDIKAIITYKSRHRAAIDGEGQVAANVVWQEWQVAGKARQLATDIIMGERMRPHMLEYYQLLKDRNGRMETALAARSVTLATVAPERVALQSARAALASLEQNQLSLRHQLNALLGMQPDAPLALASRIELPQFHPADIEAQLPDLPRRRPDLIALRLGYAAADENVRQAILSQFPDVVFGAGIASDNARVINGGPNATLGLPIFDRNQGNIAIARATRAQLHAEYSARLSASIGEVMAMVSEGDQLSGQLETARAELVSLGNAADHARAAFATTHLDERTFLDLIGNRFAKKQEVMTMELALLDRQIAIQTLLGAGLPTSDLPEEPQAVQP